MATLSTAAFSPVSTGVSSSAVAPTIVAPQGPAPTPPASAQVRFLSPIIDIDPEAGLAVLKVRDVESGDVQFQLPPERVVKEYTALNQASGTSAAANRNAPVEQSTGATPAAEPRGTFESESSVRSKSADPR
jgi:hypothetical protein